MVDRQLNCRRLLPPGIAVVSLACSPAVSLRSGLCGAARHLGRRAKQVGDFPLQNKVSLLQLPKLAGFPWRGGHHSIHDIWGRTPHGEPEHVRSWAGPGALPPGVKEHAGEPKTKRERCRAARTFAKAPGGLGKAPEPRGAPDRHHSRGGALHLGGTWCPADVEDDATNCLARRGHRMTPPPYASSEGLGGKGVRAETSLTRVRAPPA